MSDSSTFKLQLERVFPLGNYSSFRVFTGFDNLPISLLPKKGDLLKLLMIDVEVAWAEYIRMRAEQETPSTLDDFNKLISELEAQRTELVNKLLEKTNDVE